MKTKLSSLAIIALCFLSASALHAGPIITHVLGSSDPSYDISVPAGQALVVLNLASSNGSGTVAALTGSGAIVLLAAKVDVANRIDEGASSRQITIAGPTLIRVANQTAPVLVTYKLINNN